VEEFVDVKHAYNMCTNVLLKTVKTKSYNNKATYSMQFISGNSKQLVTKIYTKHVNKHRSGHT